MLVACGRLPERVLKTIKIETWIDTEPDHISKRDKHQTIKSVHPVGAVYRMRGEDRSEFCNYSTAIIMIKPLRLSSHHAYTTFSETSSSRLVRPRARRFERMEQLPHNCVALRTNY